MDLIILKICDRAYVAHYFNRPCMRGIIELFAALVSKMINEDDLFYLVKK